MTRNQIEDIKNQAEYLDVEIETGYTFSKNSHYYKSSFGRDVYMHVCAMTDIKKLSKKI